MSDPHFSRLYSALFLVSISIIAYQLLLIQVLSLIQWYHFAYMIISVALLGFGASGTILTLFRRSLLKNSTPISPILLLFCGLSIAFSLRLTQSPSLAFDSYLVFHEVSHIARLLLTYLIYFFPFFFGGLFIGLSFRSSPHIIGKLYFFNLLGSAIGGLLIIILLMFTPAQQAIAIISFLPIVAAAMTIHKKRLLWFTLLGLVSLFALYGIIKPPELYLSEYKGLSKVLNMPDTEIIAEKTSPYGLLQAVRSPYLRYAPGLSLNFQDEIPFELVIFNNGDFIGPLFPLHIEEQEHYYDYSTIALPFILNDIDKTLILDSGSGDMVSYATARDVKQIVAVDGNPQLFSFIKDDLTELGFQSSYHSPDVEIIPRDPYSFLLTDREEYDLITLPLTDAFGGSAGIYAMREKYLLTNQAFQLMWDRLSDNGMITISTWIDHPLRYPLKTLATIVELLENNDIIIPEHNIAAIRNWSMITFVVTKKPLSEDNLSKVRDFATDMGFDILLIPGLAREERSRFNILADESLFHYTGLILSPERQDFYENYPFNIKPASEIRPYFFQFLKVNRISELLEDFDLRSFPFLELGYFLVLLTFLQITVLTALFVILPLLVKKWKSTGKSWTFFYFCFLGLGFMMLEIVLIQRFIFYLGTPLYSTAVVISAVLLFSGLGSNLSSKLSGTKINFYLILSSIVLLIMIYGLFLSPLLHNTLQINLFFRILLTILYLAPLSVLLGFPFPLGIKSLNFQNENDNISWAWAINGSFSVVSTVLATIIAVEAGFFVVMLIAAGCYLLALISNLILRF
ncbi:MAG: hypothetical protein K0B81_05205 [Candidatus Cloacimonetes bacterium]|nr:hypothetical protein [Candidatus Cloacimonadota bacterium]